MADDAFDVSELKIKELPKPPAFGVWLSLIAIGLTLSAVRLIFLAMELGMAPKPGLDGRVVRSAASFGVGSGQSDFAA